LVCVAGLLALPFKTPGGDTGYVVRRNDTLYGIARRFGISPAQLADYNGLSKSGWVYIGQHLNIPSKPEAAPAAPAAPAARHVLSPAVQKAIDSANVTPGRWKYIVIHHSGVDEGTVAGMDRYHREVRHMEHGLAYHFVIGNGNGMGDGEVAVAPRWRKQLDGGHLASPAQNTYSLGICLVGNFDKHKPTAREMQSLLALVEALMKRCHLTPAAVKTHREINVIGTRCPGRYFPIQTLRQELREDYPPAAKSKSPGSS
jgi:LysM repeat protein